ncbi:helix-turn-helix domain-containing protein [Wenjunlia vitaminophila]|uniref:helix-turn-helix domain-containing protein n=1 Tax=Wenjunlia vitaminophila TaxID=76728 RepID=UPI00036A36ED|nr:helix-turn-helix domain-containing protein [Wenjunlia vitaminophila]
MSSPQLSDVPTALLALIVEEAARRLSTQLTSAVPVPEPTPERPEARPLALTVEQAAKRLGIGRTRMFALVRSGQVQSITIGRLRRIPEEALNEYVNARLNATSTTLSAA